VIVKPMRLLSPLLVLVLACACSSPDPCAKDPVQCQDAGSDGPGGPGSCTGVCLPHAPPGWYAISLLWVGAPNATPPPCPDVLPAAHPGFADTPPTVSCPSCSCSPSHGFCDLPDQLFANSSACPGGSGSQQFNAPPAWDGTCDAMGAISSASSLTVMPPPIPGGQCVPVTAGTISIQGATAAQTCDGLVHVAPGTCGDQSMVCAFPKTAGFLTCIAQLGDQQCPDGWPTRHLVFQNDQACGCQCQSPVGGSCSATVTVYADGACSQPLGSVMVSSDQPKACVDVAAGSAFKSKSSTPPVYKAGTCAPSAINEGAHLTYCCVP
jgi:hypothetical protein